jgi:maltose O-acetyltransferase
MRSIIKILLNFVLNFIPYTRYPKIVNKIHKLNGIKIGSNTKIFSSVKIIGNMSVDIGSNTSLGHATLLIGGLNSSITIGNHCAISTRVNIVTGTHEIDRVGKSTAGKDICKSIVIEDGVWIGFGVNILPGVTIGEKSIIGAGSVVVNDIPSFSVAVGNPCKVIRKL